MTDLPERPREHEVSEEAVRAFAGVLGARMLFHARRQTEYGIDGDVEEFNDSGRATGLHFFAQVKGTDQVDLRKALARSIPIKKANYYRSAPMPVLMVRYHRASDRVYVRWFHQYDPYYGRRGTKSLTFRWRPEDVWDDTTAVRVAAEARAFYVAYGAAMALPQRLFIEVQEGVAITEVELRIAFRKQAADARGIVTVVGGQREGGAPCIELRSDALIAHLAGAATATLHFPDPVDLRAIGPEQIASEGMVLLALAFEHYGQDRVAAELGRRYLHGSSLVHEHDVVFALTRSMSRSGRIADALDLSERLDDPGDPSASEAAFILGLAPVLAGRPIHGRDAEQYEKLLKLRVKRRKHDHPVEAGRAVRNLATFVRIQGRHQAAVDHYRRAAKLDPEVENDPSYWTSLAGSLWLTGSYRASAEAYARALTLAADDSFLIALHGDALLFNGEYARAAEEFQRFVDAGAEGDDGEYQIKAIALPYLLKRLGIDKQERSIDRAVKALGETEPVDDAGWAAASLAQLQHDALWGSAWFNLAKAERAAGNSGDALMCDVLSTFLIAGDTAAWLNAISASFSQHETLCTALLIVGQRIAGPGLTDLLVEHVQPFPPGFREAFLNIVDLTLEAGEARRAPTLEEILASESGSFEFVVGCYRHELMDRQAGES